MPPARSAATDSAARIHALCRHIETHAGERLSLADLAAHSGLSASHLQRRFTALIGISPHEYQQACRLGTLKERLRAGVRVSDAVQDAGYGSDSRVYEKSNATLGMTPAQYARGGGGLEISFATADTPLGALLIAATDRGICSVQLGDDAAVLHRALLREFPQARIAAMPERARAAFDSWLDALRVFLAGGKLRQDLPLDLRGTVFQQKVWRYLQTIPRGETRSYADVARAIGAPGAARAVGSACGSNRIALLIPCHRVLRGDGGDGGYRWGVARKRRLLTIERGDAVQGTPE